MTQVRAILIDKDGGLIDSDNPVPVTITDAEITIESVNMDIRDLTSASDSVAVEPGTADLKVTLDGESVLIDNAADLKVTLDGEPVSVVPPAIAPHVSNVSVGTSATAFPGTTSTSRGKVAIRNGSSVTITLCNSDGSGTFELLPKDTLVYPAGGGSVLGYAKVATGTADLQIIEMVE